MDDVVIVGGGHVGLFTACELARNGLQVRLLDQKKVIGEKVVCTGIIGEEAFTKFDLPEDTVIGTIQQLRFYSPASAYFDYIPSQPLARVVDRFRFNQHFAERALHAGVRIETNSRVEQVKVKKDEVTVHVSSIEGDPVSYKAQVIVLATGVNYKLFHSVGLPVPKSLLGGAQIHIPLEAENWTSIYFGREVAPGSFGWVVPLETGLARVGLLSEKSPQFYLKNLLDRIKPGWRDDTHANSITLRPVVQEPLERCYANRVLVVGESAGQIKTTTGGGIYYGLLGAELAVTTLKEAFRKKRFTVDLFSVYDRRWKQAIGDELRLGYYFRKLFSKLSDEQLEDLFGRMIHEGILELADREAAFDWHKNLILSIFKLPAIRRVFQNPF